MKTPGYRRGSIALILAPAGWNTVAAAANLLSMEDTEFVTKAAQGGFSEVALDRLAVERANHDMVRNFGRRMVIDHGEAYEKLLAFAASKSIELPKILHPEHGLSRQQWQAPTGADFDRQYVQAMVADQQQDVAEFERQPRDTADPDLRRLAEKKLPMLHFHLEAIRDIEESL